MEWHLLSSQVPNTQEELRKILITNRHLKSEDEFFAPIAPKDLSLADVGIDPTQMKKAVDRILIARDKKEDVLLFGDYDADGVCATGILWEALKSIGVVARPFIPHREKNGYGLSAKTLETVLAEKKPDLLITVDNGIVAHEAFAELKKRKIDAILTDHHQIDGNKVPPAYAVIHTTQLCGSTVAWFLARELNPKAAADSLDLAGIATVADQMQLQGPSRSFVKFGLEALRRTRRVGLQLLIAKAGIEPTELKVSTINYGIAPRINAMGRLKHGLDALRLICTKSLQRADQLVKELNETNTSRQELTSSMLEHALAQAESWNEDAIIIIDSVEYHEGVIGLIAGKLSEKFHKPAIVISVREGVAKASARSVFGVNIIELIRLVRDDLLEAGGHEQAAGFGLLTEKIPVVRERLLILAKKMISEKLLQPAIDVECVVDPSLLNEKTIGMISEFAPFGQGNREPVLGVKNLHLMHAEAMGREEKHIKVQLKDDGSGHKFTALGWNMADILPQLKADSEVNIAGVLELNEWKGRKTIQIILKDLVIPLR